ncbi:hypothetical protein [Spiroplasma ixodetis]|uniref:hypothetical protein n=1 Tax=Spiroplasma ixodetis TaxID=2141 RepID=UPI0025773B24|nr:hypothetical protein [Spiroplasma ixodetis]WJG70748.1 hypothetical protein SIXOD_v1c19720 [Spiroplasma ixodetis Y32]
MPKNLEKEKNVVNIRENDWEIIEMDKELRFVKVVQELKDNCYDMLDDIEEVKQELETVNLQKLSSTSQNKPNLPKL